MRNSMLLMAMSTIKETQESTAAAGDRLNHALAVAQEAGIGASTASMLAAAGTFRDAMEDGHLKADAALEVLHTTASKRLSDKTDNFPPPSKSR